MGSTNDLLRQVQAACAEQLPAKALQVRILDLLRPHVPYDGHVFALTDPATQVGTSPHADVPMLPWERLPETIRLRYLTTLNRVDTLAGKKAASLRLSAEGPEGSPLWQQVLREVGVEDTATVAFADRYGTWGFLELWRTGAAFTQQELEVLTAVADPVAAGVRAAVARTFVGPSEQLQAVGPAVILLRGDLTVEQQTEGAGTALLQLLPPDEPRAPIPAAAYNIGAALIAQEHGVGIGEPWSRVYLGGSRWVTVKASRLGDGIAVSIEPSTTSERLDLFTRACGLSEREREVITLLGIGLDTREIAGQLFLSDHTVNDHVKSALAKAGARTRQVLLARIAGPS